MSSQNRFSPVVVRLAAVLLAIVAVMGSTLAPAAAPPGRLTQERHRCKDRANRHIAAGKLDAAVAAVEKLLAIERRMFGDVHADVAESLGRLGELHEGREDFDAALRVRQEALGLRTRLHGSAHWRTVDARLAVVHAEWLKKATPANRAAVRQARTAGARAIQLWRQGKAREALKSAREALEARRTVLGEKHPEYATSLNNLATFYQAVGEYRAALPLCQQALKLRQEVLGEKHPEYAISLTNLGALYKDMGEHKRAMPLLMKARDVRKEVSGERHPDYATSLGTLAALYKSMGDHKSALPLETKARDVRKEALGERHPHYAASLNNLAALYQDMGDHKAAEPLYKRALVLAREVLGERHPHYASSLNNLALLYHDMGRHKVALPLFRQALDLYKEVLGTRHPLYATNLNNLAMLYQAMGDHKAALSLYRQALDLTREVLGTRHPNYALTLQNLARLYQAMGDSKAALSLFEQALTLTREVLGTRHPIYALSLNNLGMHHGVRGDYKAALPLFRQALALYKEVLGTRHPLYATSLHNLAVLHLAMRDHEAALPLFKQALALGKDVLGTKHPDYAATLSDLALLHHRSKQDAEALRCSEESLAITFTLLREVASVQSERQQLAAAGHVRHHLDLRLSLAEPEGDAAGAYRHVLASKGAVLFQQQQRRLFTRLLSEGRPEVRRQVQDLQRATRSVAALALAPVDPRTAAVRREQMEKLTREKEDLEAALAKQAAEFRQAKQPTPADVAAALPEGVALIDFLFFTRHDRTQTDPRKSSRRWLTAFVLRRGKPVVRVDLGEAEGIEADIQAWRESVLRRGTGGKVRKRLRQRLWEPVAKHTGGAKVVLLSPDGRLGELPFAALPGSKAGVYLAEEVATALLPVPSALTELAAPRKKTGRLAPSLLLVGDLSYSPGDKAPPPARAGEDDRSAARSGRLEFGPLVATAAEVRSVKASFGELFRSGSVTDLRGGEATKAKVRQALGRSRYAHLATHGFFNPQGERSALEEDGREGGMFGRGGVSGWHPLLLSGLALSGANREPGPGEEDGILTALEVSEMELSRLELAVLSACQTGLGKRVQGEGLLGLQRAFQAAGCRSVMASLWEVPDRATQQLMGEFYGVCWDVKKVVPRAEALRQAQVRMLRERVRGAVLRWKDEDKDGRLPPLYWAGFVLSGDWR